MKFTLYIYKVTPKAFLIYTLAAAASGTQKRPQKFEISHSFKTMHIVNRIRITNTLYQFLLRYTA